jgi:GTP:adenosylcobinamide-phosphate guanylyltransferase
MKKGLRALIMAGGKGSRITSRKPIIEICGKPMLLWILETLKSLTLDIYVAVSLNSLIIPIINTIKEVKIIFTSGYGYESDILEAVKNVGVPVIVTPCDTPFITADILNMLIDECDADICNIKDLDGYVGISYWKGFNINSYKDVVIREKILNVNNWNDYIRANIICKKSEMKYI